MVLVLPEQHPNMQNTIAKLTGLPPLTLLPFLCFCFCFYLCSGH